MAVEQQLDELAQFVVAAERAWERIEARWVGRRLRLRSAVVNPHEAPECQVYVRAGAIGRVIRLTRDPRTPLVLQFYGFPYPVAPMLENLDLVPFDESDLARGQGA